MWVFKDVRGTSVIVRIVKHSEQDQFRNFYEKTTRLSSSPFAPGGQVPLGPESYIQFRYRKVDGKVFVDYFMIHEHDANKSLLNLLILQPSLNNLFRVLEPFFIKIRDNGKEEILKMRKRR